MFKVGDIVKVKEACRIYPVLKNAICVVQDICQWSYPCYMVQVKIIQSNVPERICEDKLVDPADLEIILKNDILEEFKKLITLSDNVKH